MYAFLFCVSVLSVSSLCCVCRHVTTLTILSQNISVILASNKDSTVREHEPETVYRYQRLLNRTALQCNAYEINDPNIPTISPKSILQAVLELGKDPAVEAVFISCTNMRTLTIISTAEQNLGKLVISSNIALAWYFNEVSKLLSLESSFMSKRLPNTVENVSHS